jgi:hypothetical protein
MPKSLPDAVLHKHTLNTLYLLAKRKSTQNAFAVTNGLMPRTLYAKENTYRNTLDIVVGFCGHMI